MHTVSSIVSNLPDYDCRKAYWMGIQAHINNGDYSLVNTLVSAHSADWDYSQQCAAVANSIKAHRRATLFVPSANERSSQFRRLARNVVYRRRNGFISRLDLSAALRSAYYSAFGKDSRAERRMQTILACFA